MLNIFKKKQNKWEEWEEEKLSEIKQKQLKSKGLDKVPRNARLTVHDLWGDNKETITQKKMERFAEFMENREKFEQNFEEYRKYFKRRDY